MNKKNFKVLTLLKITPSDVSIDYVNNKKQFQLHTLLTEQRHKKTWNLSFVIKENIQEGLKMIFSVDEDIVEKYKQIVENKKYISILHQAVDKIHNAILNRKKFMFMAVVQQAV